MTERQNFSLSPEQREALDGVTEKNDVNKSRFIRKAIHHYMEDNPDEIEVEQETVELFKEL